MATEWFYGRGSDISGPVTGLELTNLAASGQVLRTDTIWQDAVEAGVPAGDMPDLFSSAAAVVPVVAEGSARNVPMAGTLAVKRGRAVAGKGATIVGQDGTNVKFRMKCTTCGHEDASWKSIAIPRGIARAGFFCSKCRKRRDVEIHGYH